MVSGASAPSSVPEPRGHCGAGSMEEGQGEAAHPPGAGRGRGSLCVPRLSVPPLRGPGLPGESESALPEHRGLDRALQHPVCLGCEGLGWRPAYRLSKDVVVQLVGAVDAKNAKDHEDHGPGVHQRPHRRLPAARVHAGVEAKCGRGAGPGHCSRSQGCKEGRPGSPGPQPHRSGLWVPFSLGT